MHRKSIAELKSLLQTKAISAVELAKHFYQRIERLNPAINAYIFEARVTALEQAKMADKALASGKAPLLAGIPIAHKDNMCTKGIRTTCASKMLDNFIPPYNATIVEKLNQAGAIMLGKLNLDEFAMGSSDETSYYGPSHNPWDLSCVPGGSSGGSAAAIAAGLASTTTGTDTGGSVRQPAALCGVIGLKPTYGRVSRAGMIALASSLDHCGPLTRTAEDAAFILQAIAGFDPKDSTSVDHPVPDYLATLKRDIRGLRIGLPKEFFCKELDTRVGDLMMNAAKLLEKQGAILKEISLPNMHLSISAYHIIAPAEASSNLARFDGVRYGYRCKDPKNLDDLYSRTRAEGFGDEVKHRIMIGTYLLSAGYYDAYYVKAQRIRRLVSEDYQKAFKEVDLILNPTTPTPAFKLGAKGNDRVAMYLSDMFTVSTNLAGIPSISFPIGFIDGLPIGAQLSTNYFEEALLLNVTHQYQRLTDWHLQIPGGFE